MRAIHIVPAIAEEASGPSYSVVCLCESLIETGQDVTLAALDWAPLANPPPFLKTFPLGLGARKVGRSPAMRRWLADECSFRHASLLHNHGMWQMNALYPAWASRDTGVRLVYSPRGAFSAWAMRHGSVTKRLFWPLLQRPAIKQAHCLHATADHEYMDIRRLGFTQPVAIIPNGIYLHPLPKRQTKADRTLLFLGRIHVVKGLELLLPAWREVQDEFKGWRLVIAGSDEGYHGRSGYLEKLKTMAIRLGLERIEFVGALYGEQKLQAMRNADLYVLPSYSENFAITVAESLSMETPVIATKGTPWSGLEAEGVGWWIDSGLDSLVACLKDAMARPREELATMGKKGRAWMGREFSWQSIGLQMAETYRWLCDRSLPVPPWVRLD
jgi:glycosyltransferase involved in cell wall biosynthesis